MFNICLDDFELSIWASFYCQKIKDEPNVRKYIAESFIAYKYCRDFNDTLEVRKYILDSRDAFNYCMNVEDRKEVRKNIKNYFIKRIYYEIKIKRYINQLVKFLRRNIHV